jgi:hypothetical protein
MQIDQVRVGPLFTGDGSPAPLRGLRPGGIACGDVQGRYYEQASRGMIYTLTMSAWTTNISAGNILGAAAAASTQFALWNPPGSKFDISILKFTLNLTSGTLPISGIWHSLGTPAPTIASSLAATSYVGNHRADIANYDGCAGYLTHVTGAALTGGGATRGIRQAGLIFTAGTLANLATNWFMDECDGDIVLPPNSFWVPTWAAQGTSMLGGYSITWEQIPRSA